MREIANGNTDYKVPATCEDLSVIDEIAKIINEDR